MLCFLGTISNVSPWSLQTISWSPLLMEGGSTVFSKVTCCCSAVLAPTLPTGGSAPAGTTSRGRLHSARTAYSSSRAAPSWGQRESLERSSSVLPALWSRFSTAGRAIIAGQNYLLREEGFIANSCNWSFLPVRMFAVSLFRFLQLFEKRNESHVRQWFEDDCTEWFVENFQTHQTSVFVVWVKCFLFF